MDEKQASQITTGLVIVVVGLILLAGQFDTGWAFDFGRLWPLIFVVLGIGRLVSRDRVGSALWFFFLGGLFLLHTYGVMSLHHSWPLFIIAGGLCIIFPGKESAERRARREAKRAMRREERDRERGEGRFES